MAQKSVESYKMGLAAGLDKALDIVQRGGGADEIQAEIRFSKVSGIDSRVLSQDLADATVTIKKLAVDTTRVAMLAAVHDAYGFGKKRLERCLKEYDKLASYMDRGWLYWFDLIQELQRLAGWDLGFSEVDHLPYYKRPEPEDAYEEPDLIDRRDWVELLERGHLSEKKLPDGTMSGSDRDGRELWSYRGAYQQVQAYDYLWGFINGREAEKARQQAVRDAKARVEAAAQKPKQPTKKYAGKAGRKRAAKEQHTL